MSEIMILVFAFGGAYVGDLIGWSLPITPRIGVAVPFLTTVCGFAIGLFAGTALHFYLTHG